MNAADAATAALSADGVVVALACFALASLFLAVGWAVKAGRLRKWPERYYYADAGSHQRNGFAMMLPCAVWSASAGAVILLAPLGRPWAYAAIPFGILIPVGMVFQFVWAARPPDFLKPQWRLEAERRDREGLPAQAPPDVVGGKIVVSERYYWAQWVLLVLIVLVCSALGLWGPLLIGLAVGLPYMTMLRRRRQ